MTKLLRAILCIALLAVGSPLAGCDSRVMVGGLGTGDPMRVRGLNTGSIVTTVQIPESRLRGRFQTKAANAEAVRALDFTIEGPGYPAHTPYSDVDATGTLIQKTIPDVPAGPFRVVTVAAKKKKYGTESDVLQRISGVVAYLGPSESKNVYITLQTTPTAEIIKQLLAADPTKVIQYTPADLDQLQNFINTVIGFDPATGTFVNNPYFVDVDAVVSDIVSHGWPVVPPGPPASYLMPPGAVKVIGAPAGSHLWLNDPVSPIVDIGPPPSDQPTIPNVVPNIGNSTWTLTVYDNGKVGRYPVHVPRGPAVVTVDFTQPEFAPSTRTAVTALRLDPSAVSFTQVESKQLYLYGVLPSLSEIFIPSGVANLDWATDDPTIATMGQRVLAADGTEDRKTSAPGLATPVGSGVTTLRATLKDDLGATLATGSCTATVNFGFPGAQTTIQTDHNLAISPSTLTINSTAITPLTALEPNVNASYNWVSSDPSVIDFVNTKANPVQMLPLKNGTVTVTCISSTGRKKNALVTVSFGGAGSSGTAQLPTITAGSPPTNKMVWTTWTAAMASGNPAMTITQNNPYGGNLGTSVTTNINGYLNTLAGQALLQAADPQFGNAFSWSTSNAGVVALSGPTQSTDVVTLTAMTPGESIITARNSIGQAINTRIVVYTGTGSGTLTFQAPTPAPGLALSALSAPLNVLGGSATLTVTSNGQPISCAWSSGNANTLKIEPKNNASFPDTQAKVTALDVVNNVPVLAVDLATGRRVSTNVNSAFNVNGTGNFTKQTQDKIQITQPPSATYIGTVTVNTLGQIVTLRALDKDDANASFAWATSDPSVATIVATRSNEVDIRMLRPGITVTITSQSLSTGHMGWRGVVLSPTPSNSSIQVTL